MLGFLWSFVDAILGWLGWKQQASLPAPKMHVKCRNAAYPRAEGVRRAEVPDAVVPWSVPCAEYAPVDYTAPSVASGPVWADSDFRAKPPSSPIGWNTLDGKVDRRSHEGEYDVVDGLPRNPIGRTGICSRGLLGRWGPNHAADPIVTRWKRTESGEIVKKDGRPVLQFVAIERGDSGEWAIPGGMVDPGEAVSVTLKREFLEEAMDSGSMGDGDKKATEEQIAQLFNKGTEVYRGYVDDPRNTDNAWMETVALNFHDDNGDSVGKFHLHAGDDAVGVKWMDIDGGLSLYASHLSFVQKVAENHNAYW